MDPVKQEMLARGICYFCAAYCGIKEKKCRAMSDGCPVPNYIKLEMERMSHGANKKR